MNSIGSEDKPLEVAIIGSGPSGYYAAQSLFGSEKKINITMFDRLPTPYGLVRGGVAPDHQKIKNVIRSVKLTRKNKKCYSICETHEKK